MEEPTSGGLMTPWSVPNLKKDEKFITALFVCCPPL